MGSQTRVEADEHAGDEAQPRVANGDGTDAGLRFGEGDEGAGSEEATPREGPLLGQGDEGDQQTSKVSGVGVDGLEVIIGPAGRARSGTTGKASDGGLDQGEPLIGRTGGP